MKIGFLINDFETLKASQTTAGFMQVATDLGHEVLVFAVIGVSVDVNGVVKGAARTFEGSDDLKQSLHRLRLAEEASVTLKALDTILIRTNPGRIANPQLHDDVLGMLRTLEDSLPVINRPSGLQTTSTKFFLTQLPDWTRPRTIVTSSSDLLREFVAKEPKAAVLKPVRGTRGEGVFKVTAADPNLNAIVQTLTNNGMVMAQAFVPEAVDGDTRVVVLDGEPLTIDGETLAINRVPTGSDFRSNIHVGGRAQPGIVTEGMRKVIAASAPMLQDNGIRLSGFDFLGDVVCEINVYSTGGFGDGERFFDRPFTAYTLEKLLDG